MIRERRENGSLPDPSTDMEEEEEGEEEEEAKEGNNEEVEEPEFTGKQVTSLSSHLSGVA